MMVERRSTMFLVAILLSLYAASAQNHQLYIVYLGTPSSLQQGNVADYHKSLFSDVLGSESLHEDAILYHYSYGFAAKMTAEQAQAFAEHQSVLTVFLSKKRVLHTTESWNFLGLAESNKDSLFKKPMSRLWSETDYGRDIVIGHLDTGVWPEAQSFSDEGLRPIPKSWRGKCVSGDSFNSSNCNRKIIGARYYVKGYEYGSGVTDSDLRAAGEYLSPRDSDGHGTHTASTATGAFVAGANIFGYGNGTASGGAPRVRLSTYKVCWGGESGGCTDADILAAFDDAVRDGVDLITMSIGGPANEYDDDGIAIGTYHAMQHGILVVCSAGNDGPTPGTVSNVAPWILTVAASTEDRLFASTLLLGDNQTFEGQTLSSTHLEHKLYPLISGTSAALDASNTINATLCIAGSLDANLVKGKIVACLRGVNARVDKGVAVVAAGGAGMILCNAPSDGNEVEADPHFLPAVHLNAIQGQAVFDYINSTANPMAYLTKPTTKLNVKPAPSMASFSSRGPNIVTPDILKPDIAAPGVNILAAYTEATSPTGLPLDHRRVKFNVLSGTSMACPHVAGILALVKAYHPTWSPAALKSAIVTTGYVHNNLNEGILDSDNTPATPFAFGGGHVNPNAAAHPGLVYDATEKDYVKFLCALGYNRTMLASLGENASCSRHPPGPSDLNYPSISISNLKKTRTIRRQVTNVGDDEPTVYRATIEVPKGIHATVIPSTLKFHHKGQTKKFRVKFHAKHDTNGSYVFGHLIWKNDKHTVTSPIAILAN